MVGRYGTEKEGKWEEGGSGREKVREGRQWEGKMEVKGRSEMMEKKDGRREGEEKGRNDGKEG